MNLARVLSTASRAHSDRIALHYNERSLTFGELEHVAALATSRLRALGVEPGDRVALRLPNGPAFIAAWLGGLRLGAVVVPLNPLLADQEIAERLRISGARLLVDDEEMLRTETESGHEIVERDGADPAVILFTSGTSGRAKGAVLTHGGIRAAAGAAATALDLTPEDVVLGAAPFSHVLGQSTGLVATLSVGASVAIIERFQAEEALSWMSVTRTTILLGVPTMCIALCEAARSAAQLPPVRIAHIGGAPVPVEVASEFERVFGGEVHEGYGLTEMSGIATTFVAGQPRKRGSVGMVLGETEMRIVALDGRVLPENEPGEVEFRGRPSSPATGETRKRPPRPSRTTAGSRRAMSAMSTRRDTSFSSTARRM